jgi:2-alkyl-3-oxoalkanoate reductase
MSVDQEITAGLVGAGYISEFHIRALRRLKNVRIIGITDVAQDRAQEVADRFGLPAVFPSLPSMRSASPDVIHILTPPDTHAHLAIQALEMGCHVLVEKPLATSVEDCDAIAAAARKAGRQVCVDHALLYDHFVRGALDIVRSGRIGQVVGADYIRAGDYPPYNGGPLPPQYREGGYPFRDLGVHALYLMEAFLGEIQDVQAQFATRGGDPNLLYDEWRTLVRCRNGIGHVQMSWNIRPHQHLLLVQGTRGVIRADLFGLSLTTRRLTRLPRHAEHAWNTCSEGLSFCTQVPANMFRIIRGKIMRYHGLQKLVEDFYQRLARGEPSPVPVEQARSGIHFVEQVARPADAAKEAFLARFPRELSAKVLVTGAAGFIGRRLLDRLLEQHDRIRIFVRRQPPPALMDDPRIEVVLGDLGDPHAVDRAVAGIDTLYHVGAAIRGSKADFDRGTVVGTRNIVDSARRHGVRKLVYISSLSVLYAAAPRDDRHVREDWPLEPHPECRGEYTRTKLEAEKIVLQAIREHSLPAVLLRPGLVFGDGAPLMSPAVALRARNRLVILGDGKGILPLVYVEDVVDAIIEAGRRDGIEGQIFHVVDSTIVTQEQLAREYIRATGGNLRIMHLPRFVVYGLAGMAQLAGRLLRRAAPMSIYRMKSAMSFRPYECTAAEQHLGWRPRIGVKAGLQATLSSLQP